MSLFRKTHILLPALVTFFSFNAFSQAKSAIQFYDSTGSTKTGKIGWSGDANTGHAFILIPNISRGLHA